MSQYYNSRRIEWAKKIEQCLQSGKSMQSWCRDNQIVYTTFMGWRKRLKAMEKRGCEAVHSAKQFIELKNEEKVSPGFTLECNGVMIHLQAEFDAQSLKKCLAVLRGAPC